MSNPIDYDAPRRAAADLEDNGLQELNALSAAERSPGADLEEAETFDLPGEDLSGEELSVAVVPMRSDEFRCERCFLVRHRSQLAEQSNGREICTECS